MDPAPRAGAAAGVDLTPHLALALTHGRLLLYRRNPFGRPRDVLWESPLSAVADVRISRGGIITIELEGDAGVPTLESPRGNLKHLPAAYAGLPEAFRTARSRTT